MLCAARAADLVPPRAPSRKLGGGGRAARRGRARRDAGSDTPWRARDAGKGARGGGYADVAARVRDRAELDKREARARAATTNSGRTVIEMAY